ncbi:hypothetical protein ACIOC1_05550 [Streptomyces sp. NPDC088197]|uniref:hypothetical protein n=1 Tax=Streptomyces sp. NPDC088197 TaxID=3365840 RepID=UPI00382B8FD1
MKTTMLFRPIANPRRTTLAHLKDAAELGVPAASDTEAATTAEQAVAEPLPQVTANPRRTVVHELPTA